MKIILPSLNIGLERWKWNKEFRVFVSNKGKFKNKRKEIIPVKINQKGYVIIYTCRGYVLAHRLVMYTWCPIPNREGMTVDHLNHNKRNNKVSNLEWITLEENQERASRDFVSPIQERKGIPPQEIETELEGNPYFHGVKIERNKVYFKNQEEIIEFFCRFYGKTRRRVMDSLVFYNRGESERVFKRKLVEENGIYFINENNISYINAWRKTKGY